MAGVTLVLFSVLLIAIGANVQRLALRDIPPEARVCGCLSARTMGWFGGLCIYFFANVLYTLGLVYAPASLCATLVAAIIPVNALTSFLITTLCHHEAPPLAPRTNSETPPPPL